MRDFSGLGYSYMGPIVEGEFDFCSDIVLTPVCYSDSLIKSTLF